MTYRNLLSSVLTKFLGIIKGHREEICVLQKKYDYITIQHEKLRDRFENREDKVQLAQKSEELRQLEFKIQELKEKIQLQNVEYKKIYAENIKLRTISDSIVVEDSNIKKKLKIKESELKIITEKYEVTADELEIWKSKIMAYDKRVKEYQNIFDSMIVKMKTVKSELKRLTLDNNQLREGREKMQTLYSFGIDELTPRPDFEKILATHKIKLLTSTSNPTVSTSDKLENLIRKLLKTTKRKMNKLFKGKKRMSTMGTDSNQMIISLTDSVNTPEIKRTPMAKKFKVVKDALELVVGTKMKMKQASDSSPRRSFFKNKMQLKTPKNFEEIRVKTTIT